jgi:pimeloyl-ACP methyl ester carboxylesterase
MVPGVPTVLYLHGFASSPAGRKIALLREALEPEGVRVVAPDLNRPSFRKLDFEAMVAEAVRAAEAENPDVVVASSLGALVALAAAKVGRLTAPLILVAPALGFGSRWIESWRRKIRCASSTMARGGSWRSTGDSSRAWRRCVSTRTLRRRG